MILGGTLDPPVQRLFPKQIQVARNLPQPDSDRGELRRIRWGRGFKDAKEIASDTAQVRSNKANLNSNRGLFEALGCSIPARVCAEFRWALRPG